MAEVLCLGDSCADIIIPYGESLSDPEASVTFNCGGAAANTACALGKLGVDVAFAGKAGKDLYGISMKRELSQNNVNVSHFVLSDNQVSTQILIVIDENKDRHPFLMPKANPSYLEVYPEELNQIDLTGMKYILTNGMMLFDDPAAYAITSFLKKAHEKGVQILLDINYRPETINKNSSNLKEIIHMADFLLGSAVDDYIAMTGINDLDEVAKILRNDHNVIVAHDEKGSTVFDGRFKEHVNSFEVRVCDTIGAGDNFNAGFIYGLVNNKSLGECNRLGCAVAAFSLTRPGARNTPDQKQLEMFLNK
ncbi:MAG: carbohydrate kinase family protein [Erysipelotrichaceae bacterium]|nr:carbohydrate kinase family protein [Erysipelotrichaceae bacterium]